MKLLLQLMMLILLLSGCGDPKTEFIEKLTNNSSKYWNLECVIRGNGEKIILPRLMRCKKFSVNGEFLEFLYHGKYIYDLHQYSDVIVPNKWEYIDAHTIRLNGGKVHLKYLSEDTLIYFENGEEFIFTKSLYNLDSLIIDSPMPDVIIY
ncbi:MAG: hypothetical protein QE487_12295 [Fluviicola sp.]|nr:hypothetical protein [Fluviicola sp.]